MLVDDNWSCSEGLLRIKPSIASREHSTIYDALSFSGILGDEVTSGCSQALLSFLWNWKWRSKPEATSNLWTFSFAEYSYRLHFFFLSRLSVSVQPFLPKVLAIKKSKFPYIHSFTDWVLFWAPLGLRLRWVKGTSDACEINYCPCRKAPDDRRLLFERPVPEVFLWTCFELNCDEIVITSRSTSFVLFICSNIYFRGSWSMRIGSPICITSKKTSNSLHISMTSFSFAQWLTVWASCIRRTALVPIQKHKIGQLRRSNR